ncbi:hypothetical protein CDLVIII_0456 [Clostridium sp. DL-VIII]|nr:hypothetical protein CDLVIII_0456 [Clostridium sp. DL-VIII]
MFLLSGISEDSLSTKRLGVFVRIEQGRGYKKILIRFNQN